MTNPDKPYDTISDMDMDEDEATIHDIIFMLGEYGEYIEHATKALEHFDYDKESEMIRLQLLRSSMKLNTKGILDAMRLF